jgi:PleD family two-component response regulator
VNYKEKDVMDVLAESVNEYNSGESREFELAYSVGVVDYTPGKDDVEEVMKKADEEMYKMKESKS